MFAVSKLFGKEPEKLSLNVTDMKNHVIKIFEKRTLKVFPFRDRNSVSLSLLERNQNGNKIVVFTTN